MLGGAVGSGCLGLCNDGDVAMDDAGSGNGGNGSGGGMGALR
jgi:hypothetical protein